MYASTDGFAAKTKVIEGPNVGTLSAANGGLVCTQALGPHPAFFVTKLSPTEYCCSTYFGGSRKRQRLGDDHRQRRLGVHDRFPGPRLPGNEQRLRFAHSKPISHSLQAGPTEVGLAYDHAAPGDNSAGTALAIAADGGIILAGTVERRVGHFYPGLPRLPRCVFSIEVLLPIERLRAAIPRRWLGDRLGHLRWEGHGIRNRRGFGIGGAIYTAGSGGIFYPVCRWFRRCSVRGSRRRLQEVQRSPRTPAGTEIYTYSDGDLNRWRPIPATGSASSVPATTQQPLRIGSRRRTVASRRIRRTASNRRTVTRAIRVSNRLPGFLQIGSGSTRCHLRRRHRAFVASGIAGLPAAASRSQARRFSRTRRTARRRTFSLVRWTCRSLRVRLDTIVNAASFVARSRRGSRGTLLLRGGPFADNATVVAEIESSGGITVPVAILARSANTLTVELDASLPARNAMALRPERRCESQHGEDAHPPHRPVSTRPAARVRAKPWCSTGRRPQRPRASSRRRRSDHGLRDGRHSTISPSLFVGGIYANGIDATA